LSGAPMRKKRRIASTGKKREKKKKMTNLNKRGWGKVRSNIFLEKEKGGSRTIKWEKNL